MPGWIKDMNINIVKRNDDGTPKHWKDGDSYGKVPDTELGGAVHSMYRITLCHNVLMNLFGDQHASNATEFTNYLTFDKYYNSPIHEVFEYFANRVESIPTDANDDDEMEFFNLIKLEQFESDLREAADFAKKKSSKKEVRRLYETEDDTYDGDVLQEVRKILMRSRNTLTWICIPFLAFVDPKRNPRPRWVSIGDINTHITGNAQMIGIGDKTYLDFIYFSPADATDSTKFINAMNFATTRCLFDNESVVERRRRETGRGPISYGGGNGWQCDVDPQTNQKRGCKVGMPQQYCVNNGSQFC